MIIEVTFADSSFAISKPETVSKIQKQIFSTIYWVIVLVGHNIKE